MKEFFSDQVAIVTGAGKGIGQAIAIAFAKLGARVVISGRSKEPLEETLSVITNCGGEAVMVIGDVADEEIAIETVDAAIKKFGRLDFAVNNAGISPQTGKTADVTPDMWDSVINTNLKGTWLGMKYQIPAMLKNGGGSIVNLASVGALMVFEGYAPYSASKCGVVGLTKVAAVEYAAKGIRINAIAPGSIATPLFQEVIEKSPANKEDFENQTPMKRIANSDEVAAAATWLCSEAASFITGVVLPVDGGMTL